MRLPKQWLSVLSVNSIFLFNLGLPLSTLPTTLHRGEVIAQTDPNVEADRLLKQGFELFQQGTAESKKQAIVVWEKALQLYQQAENVEGQAVSLLGLGRIHDLLGDKQQALEFYNQSLPLSQQVGDKAGEARTLNNIGLVYDALGDKQQALEFYNQSLPLSQQVGDKAGEARTLNNIGLVYDALGDKQQALEFYNQSLPLSQQVGDKAGEATTLNNIGLVYDALGDKQQALEFYNQSLPLRRQVGDKAGEATTLNNIGGVYSALGDKQQALEFYNQSLPLRRQVGDKAGEAATLNNIGRVYDALGDKQQALEYYNQSLPLSRQVGDKAGEATTLNNIGGVYSALGDKQQALEFYNQSLPLSQQVGDKAGEAATLNNIGRVYDALGDKQQALEYYNQSLPLSRQVGDKAGEATTLNNIGGVYSALGDKQQALEFYNQSLPLWRQVGDKTGEATTLNNIGGVYDALGDKQQALEFYNQSLPLSRQVGDKAGEALTLYNFAFLKRSQGNLTEALTDIESAIAIIEELRTKIISQDLRTSYFATVYGYYEFYIDLLMELHEQNPNQGYDTKALHASERGRARSLLDILAESGANIKKGVDPELLAEEQKLLQRLTALDQSRQLNPGERDFEELKQEIEAVRRELQNLEVEIKRNSPQYANLKYPEPLTASEIQQQVLDDETVLLVYSLGRDRSFLWFVSSTEVKSYQLPKREEIEQLSQSFLAEIQSQAVVPPSGEKLSRVLLSPVMNQLGNKRLVIVGDGILQTVPFAALPISSPVSSPLNSMPPKSLAPKPPIMGALIDGGLGKMGDLEKINSPQTLQLASVTSNTEGTFNNLEKINSPQSWGDKGGLSQTWETREAKLISTIYSPKSPAPKPPIMGALIDGGLGKMGDLEKINSPQTLQLASVTSNTEGTFNNLEKINSPQSWGDKGGLSQTWETREAKLISTIYSPKSPAPKPPIMGALIDGGLGKMGDFEFLSQTLQLASVTSNTEGTFNNLEKMNSPQIWGARGAINLSSNASGAKYTPLIVQHEIITLPSASSLDILREQVQGRTPAPKKVAVIADPVFEENDSRFQGDYQVQTETRNNDVNYIALRQSNEAFLGKSMSRLYHTRDEAEAILALVPDNLEQLALDFNATRQAATNSSLNQYQIVHFATHGLLNETQPELSGLVFSLYDQQGTEKPGFLQLSDIFNLTLSADLVVLSACETGIGQEIRGEGLVSLTRGFMYAGAERVVVSLWAVADSSTSEFMQNYYRKILETSSNPVTAMRETQLEMLQSNQYNAPYFWASFVFQGEWN